MNFHCLRSGGKEPDELYIINGSVAVDGVIIDIPGMARRGDQLCLYGLQANEDKSCREEFCLLKYGTSVCMGSESFAIRRAVSRPLLQNALDWSNTLLLYRFLMEGYMPGHVLEERDFQTLRICEISLDGSYEKIPLKGVCDTLRFEISRHPRSYPVQMELSLQIGCRRPDPICLPVFGESGCINAEHHGESEQLHMFYIHRVYLMDLWEETDKIFEEACRRDLESQECLERQRVASNRHTALLCPKGMLVPVIEYEAAEGVSLGFKMAEDEGVMEARKERYREEQAALGEYVPRREDEPADAFAMCIWVDPEQETGAHGMKLKSKAILWPVLADTQEITVRIECLEEMMAERTLVVSKGGCHAGR